MHDDARAPGVLCAEPAPGQDELRQQGADPRPGVSGDVRVPRLRADDGVVLDATLDSALSRARPVINELGTTGATRS